MIGKIGLSIYLPRSVTRIDVPDGFLEPDTAYNWEVLAIERSGNETLSSGSFSRVARRAPGPLRLDSATSRRGAANAGERMVAEAVARR